MAVPCQDQPARLSPQVHRGPDYLSNHGLGQLALDFASLYNIQDPEALEKFQSGLAGMSRPLRQYGVNLLDSAIQAEAMAMGLGKSRAELTEQEKVLARLSIIMKTMTEQGAVGDAIRTAGSFQNRMKALRAQIRDTAVEIGKALLPVVTPLVGKAVEVVKVMGAIAADPLHLCNDDAELVAYDLLCIGGPAVAGRVQVCVEDMPSREGGGS